MSRHSLIPALALLAACATYGPGGGDTVGPGYGVGGGEWNSGGGITAAAGVRERDGRTAVCGAWAAGSQAAITYGWNDDVMAAAAVSVAGERLVQNLSFMTEARGPQALPGAQANCVTSSVTWRAEFADARPRLHFPRMVFVDDPEAGNQYVFREMLRPDILR